MHLRTVYQHLSTSSYPLWLRGSPPDFNCPVLPESTCLRARQAPPKHPLLKTPRAQRMAGEVASVTAGVGGRAEDQQDQHQLRSYNNKFSCLTVTAPLTGRWPTTEGMNIFQTSAMCQHECWVFRAHTVTLSSPQKLSKVDLIIPPSYRWRN